MTVWFVGLLTASAPAKMRRNILFLAKRNFSRFRTLPATGSSGPHCRSIAFSTALNLTPCACPARFSSCSSAQGLISSHLAGRLTSHQLPWYLIQLDTSWSNGVCVIVKARLDLG